MDEKQALGLQTLKKQMDAHLAGAVAAHVEGVAPKAAALEVASAKFGFAAPAPQVSAITNQIRTDGFCGTWDKYYPYLRTLLSGASWFIPGPVVPVLKGLFETIDVGLVHGEQGKSLCGPKK